jgi:hypothetical protein
MLGRCNRSFPVIRQIFGMTSRGVNTQPKYKFVGLYLGTHCGRGLLHGGGLATRVRDSKFSAAFE